MAEGTDTLAGSWLLLFLKLRVWLSERVRLNDNQVMLLWAGVIGAASAVASVGFRELTAWAHWLFTQYHGGYVEAFSHLPWWQRLLVPAVGGALAGATLLFGSRWTSKKTSTDYMEAVVVGEGVVPGRMSLVKCTSALLSIASGASIGREGPLVQLSAVIASQVGRLRNVPTMKRRLLVACGAAAGIAAAYNAPIGGALFVAEIVLQSVAMESFGPLVFASVIATLTSRQLLGTGALYQIPPVEMRSNWEILPHAVLGIGAGLLAPVFLRLLRGSESLFSVLRLPIYLRLALGGAIVGALAILHPEVCGNGYSTVNSILREEWLWDALLAVLVFKVLATAASFGSGAVGGVFTPTLFVGASIGCLAGQAASWMWPHMGLIPQAYTVVGMGAFLAATTHAPLMAIIMLFEMTLDYQMILPLMLACVLAHFTSSAFEKKSIYADSLRRKGGDDFRQRLSELRVAELMKPNPAHVSENAPFGEIAQNFITHRFNYLYVVDAAGHFKGAIALHDIKNYLHHPDLADCVIARDVVREDFPSIAPDASVTDALAKFGRHDGERLPILDGSDGRKLEGTISKTDLILALAEQTKTGSESAGKA
jgi:CIC family chloride channel protein